MGIKTSFLVALFISSALALASESGVKHLEKAKVATSDTVEATLPVLIVQNSRDEKLDENVSNDLSRFGNTAQVVSNKMESIINEELGLRFIQHKLDELSTKKTWIDYKDILYSIVDKMNQKISKVHSLIEVSGETIEEMFREQFTSNVTTTHIGCCDAVNNDNKNLKRSSFNRFGSSFNYEMYDRYREKERLVKPRHYKFDRCFQSWINTTYACDMTTGPERQFFTPNGPNLTQQFEANMQGYPSIKWQYFMSFLDVHVEYPAYMPPNDFCGLQASKLDHAMHEKTSRLGRGFHNLEMEELNDLNQQLMQRHRENLLASALPQQKLVILIIDHGSSLTEHQMNIAKAVSKFILNSLSHQDRVAIVDLTHVVDLPAAHVCQSKLEMPHANQETKHFFSKYIDQLERCTNSTNHALGFQIAFDILSANYAQDNASTFIAYISRGMLSSITEAKPVMQTISSNVANTTYPVVINCYALIDESKPILYETVFLQEISAMNFKKFKATLPPADRIRTGLMVSLNNTDNLGFILNGIFAVLPRTDHIQDDTIYISLPHYDVVSKDVHISLSQGVLFYDRLLGVVGADISFFDFAEDILDYPHPEGSYTFLVDAFSAKLLYHPVFGHPSRFVNKNKPFGDVFGSDYLYNSFIIMEHVEPALNHRAQLRHAILHQDNGQESVALNFSKSHGSKFNFLNDWQSRLANYSSVVYSWQRITHSPYIVVLAVYDDHRKLSLDLDPNRLIATQLKNTVNHRLDSLVRPNATAPKYCKHFNQVSTLDHFSLYLSPKVFKSSYTYEMRSNSPWFVDKIMAKAGTNLSLHPNLWMDVLLAREAIDSWKVCEKEMAVYTVRKYIATVSGAMLFYPGMAVHDSYKPSSRPWYQRAVAHPHQTMFSPPYLDVGGTGFIVTLSRAIRKHNDQVWAIVAIDLTLSYLQKLLEQSAPDCVRNMMLCFLMDDYGYLVFHSSFAKLGHPVHFATQHLAHREPQIMNDLLSQSQFVRKLSCNSFIDRTEQRYYMFNTSLVGILTSIEQSEKTCTKYKITSLASTNVFLGMINRSCSDSVTFCPCSMTDRLCLNCHRIEQTDCECPCECPLILNLCNGKLENDSDQQHLPVCPMPARPLQKPQAKQFPTELKSCYERKCEGINLESECQAIPGCQWCFVSDGDNSDPRRIDSVCVSNELCPNSYTLLKDAHLYRAHSQYEIVKDILLFFSLLALLVLLFQIGCSLACSKHRSLPSQARNNQDDLDNILQRDNRASHAEFNSDNDRLFEPVVEALEQLPSPYRINSNYQRPTIESDCGYSTMTNNDSSEMSSVINSKITKSIENVDSLSSLSLPSESNEESQVPLKNKALAKHKSKLINKLITLPVVNEDPLSNQIL